MSCKIFISYRRDDTNDATAWLFGTWLKPKFGDNLVFMDTASIEPGQPWPDTIQKTLEDSEIALIVIGNKWLDIAPNGMRRRIDDENDWVRREIETAIRHNKLILPLLVNGANPLTEETPLPDPIKKLYTYQALRINVTAAGNSGVEELISRLNNTLSRNGPRDELKSSLQKILVDKYQIEKEIGKGPISKVYLASDKSLDRHIAIKVIDNPDHNFAFIENLRSAERMVELIPNCIQFYTASLERDPIYVIMNYLDGGTLRKEIEDTDNGLPLAEVHKYLTEICDALLKLHEAGITHCNIKPSNIILNSNKDPYLSPLCKTARINKKIVVENFSRAIHDPESKEYQEDLAYLAPEIFDNTYVARSTKENNEKIDQYMVGLMGYEMLTGKIPPVVDCFSSLEIMGLEAFKKQKLEFIGNIRKDCPSKLSGIIHKMINIDPYKRYRDMTEVVHELNEVSFHAVEIAKDSYARCLSNDDPANGFFKVFYAELIKNPQAAEKFKDKAIGEESDHRQYDMLRQAIFILLLFAERRLGNREPNVLTFIAEKHNKHNYNIGIDLYGHFINALCNTVYKFDPQCKINDREKERIESAWRKALDPGIEYMIEQYGGK